MFIFVYDLIKNTNKGRENCKPSNKLNQQITNITFQLQNSLLQVNLKLTHKLGKEKFSSEFPEPRNLYKPKTENPKPKTVNRKPKI